MRYVSKEGPLKQGKQPDYSDAYYWAALPGKKDLSDSIPADVRKLGVDSLDADVFFIHPTTLTDGRDSSWNADLMDHALNAKTDYSTILYQASAFNECRLYAPRYRQAHIRSYFTTDTLLARKAFALAYEDVRASFRYYLDHYNHGRPIIIASHSQGSTHAQKLLKEFFENDILKHRLVAAYIPGMYLSKNYFINLKLCTDSGKTGCVVTWRTYRTGYEPEEAKKEKNTAAVTNPLSWTLTDEHIDFSKNHGGIISSFNTLRPGICDAVIHNGLLWVARPRIPGSVFLRMKNFHIGDINLFYMNIRTNIRTRVANYFKENK